MQTEAKCDCGGELRFVRLMNGTQEPTGNTEHREQAGRERAQERE